MVPACKLQLLASIPKLLKPTCLVTVFGNERNHVKEKPKHCDEKRLPLSATRGSLYKATEIQHRGQEEKVMTEDEMAGWHHGLDGCEFE